MEERLQKYMARCGVASRRKCEEIICSGKVKVNDIVVDSLGTKVDPSVDVVSVNNKVIRPEENKVYIMLNKPEGYVTTNKDEKNRKTILDIVKVNERIYPIGRLDYDSSGLLLLTNDGDLANEVLAAENNHEKEYIVTLDQPFYDDFIEKMERGVEILGQVTKPCKVNRINENTYSIILTQGLNRQIRRMSKVFGFNVVKLERIRILNITLEDIEYGKWRYINREEIEILKKLIK